RIRQSARRDVQVIVARDIVVASPHVTHLIEFSCWHRCLDLSGLFSDPNFITRDGQKKQKQRADETAADLCRNPASSEPTRVCAGRWSFGFRGAPGFFLVSFERRLGSPCFRFISGAVWPALLLGLRWLAGSEPFEVGSNCLGGLVALRRSRRQELCEDRFQ